MSYDGHTSNVTGLGFQDEGKWMYTGSEDGTIKIWDLRYDISESHCISSSRGIADSTTNTNTHE